MSINPETMPDGNVITASWKGNGREKKGSNEHERLHNQCPDDNEGNLKLFRKLNLRLSI